VKTVSESEFTGSDKLGLGAWVLIALVFVVGAMAVGSIQFQKVELVGADAYHHTRVAQLISEHGVLDSFPWTQTSVFKDAYVDKQFLFHVLLIPFVGQDLWLGPKILTVLLMAFLLALVAWVLLKQGIAFPWFWVTLLLAAGGLFYFRMSLTRPHLLSVPLTVLASHFLLRRQWRGAFVVSLLFPLCYTAAHLLPLLAVLFAIAGKLRNEPIPWKLIAAVWVGTLIGLVLHPNRGNIIELWYLQNVEVIINAWRMPADIGMGTEFRSPSGKIIVWDACVPLAAMLLPSMLLLARGARASLRTLFWFMITVGFFLLFLQIARFIEYWAPFAILFAASAFQDLAADSDPRGFLTRHRVGGPLLAGLGMLLLLFQTTRSVLDSQGVVARDHSLYFQKVATWINGHVPAGQTVYTSTWDATPFLLHFAPHQRYLVTLDPTFMQAYDPALFKLWHRIGGGKESHAAELIRSRFHAHWALIEHRKWLRPFLKQAKQDPRFLLAYRGTNGTLFALPPDALTMAAPLLSATLAATVPMSFWPSQFETGR